MELLCTSIVLIKQHLTQNDFLLILYREEDVLKAAGYSAVSNVWNPILIIRSRKSHFLETNVDWATCLQSLLISGMPKHLFHTFVDLYVLAV